MRFMMLVRADKHTESGALPEEELLSAMGRYNQELLDAGALIELAGLHPSSRGVRVRFSGRERAVAEGPFKGDLIAGFWLIQVSSMDEAVQWARRVPFQDGEVELRPVFELDEFPPGEAIDQARELEENLTRRK